MKPRRLLSVVLVLLALVGGVLDLLELSEVLSKWPGVLLAITRALAHPLTYVLLLIAGIVSWSGWRLRNAVRVRLDFEPHRTVRRAILTLTNLGRAAHLGVSAEILTLSDCDDEPSPEQIQDRSYAGTRRLFHPMWIDTPDASPLMPKHDHRTLLLAETTTALDGPLHRHTLQFREHAGNEATPPIESASWYHSLDQPFALLSLSIIDIDRPSAKPYQVLLGLTGEANGGLRLSQEDSIEAFGQRTYRLCQERWRRIEERGRRREDPDG